MDHPALVRVGQRRRHLFGDANRVRNGQSGFLIETVPERSPVHVGHDVVQQPVGVARLDQHEDVGMTQPRHDIDLAHETIRSERRGEFRTKHLDRDFALMLDVLAEVDGGHTAFA